MAHEHAVVRSHLGPLAPSVRAYSNAMFRSTPPTFSQFPLLYIRSLLSMPFDKTAQRNLAETAKWAVSGRGYFSQQSTRPQTLGYGLSDSPVGLLGWIYEKLVGWSDNYSWTDDEGALSRFYVLPVTVLTRPCQSSSGSPSTGSRAPGRQTRPGYTTR